MEDSLKSQGETKSSCAVRPLLKVKKNKECAMHLVADDLAIPAPTPLTALEDIK